MNEMLKNLFKNLTIKLLIFRKIVKKLLVLCLLFFIPMLYAKTKECHFLERINCTDCPAPLMFNCGGDIRFIKSTTQLNTVKVVL